MLSELRATPEKSANLPMFESKMILLVEDDPAVLSAIKRRLVFEGYRVEIARTGPEALEQAATLSPDLVLMDVMLPEMDGLEVTERLRRISSVPVLMLTAKDATSDVVAGFERGADDYVVKPFVIEELLARIRALLRRLSGPEAGAAVSFADLVLNPATHEASRDGSPLPLTAREFALLEHFMRHPRQVLTREQIFIAVWGSTYLGDSNIIDVNVRALREKLESGGARRVIQTVRGVGYALRES